MHERLFGLESVELSVELDREGFLEVKVLVCYLGALLWLAWVYHEELVIRIRVGHQYSFV